MKFFLLFATILGSVCADIYMHFPPGANGRNRERNDNRNNGNRLYDTQNNAKGGYPWRGDPKEKSTDDGMIFKTGSEVHIKWTNQHGCGPNPTLHCTTIIQVACDGTTKPDGTNLDADDRSDGYSAGTLIGLRDGYPTGGVQTQAKGQADNDNTQEPKYLERIFQNANQNQDGTNTIPENEAQAGCRASITKKSLGSMLFADAENLMEGTCAPSVSNDADPQHTALEFGMHEDYYYYMTHCRKTQRNMGLYTADRKLNRKDASATRQNPNGNRRGFECPEERDYFPWWNPSPWIDVAVLTSDPAWCPYYQKESQNVKSRFYCDVSEKTLLEKTNNQQREAPIAQTECEQVTGVWREVKPYSEWPEYKGVIKEPECRQADYSPQNSLGFTDGGTDYATYVWKIPEFISAQKCVIRLRYNISTEDYPSMAGFILPEDVDIRGTSDGTDPSDPESIVPEAEVSEIFDKRFNCPYIQNTGNGDDPDAATGGTGGANDFDCLTGLKTKLRPRYNRPEIQPFGKDEPYISIALNTDQAGRTFQDRSYVMNIMPKSQSNKHEDCDKVINVATMGKRGNIVQSYPAVEYDWSPDNVDVKQGECLDFHIYGSDFNAAKNPNNGEGWKYSDRTNIMQKSLASHNFPAFNEILAQDEETAFFNEKERYNMAYLGQKEALEEQGHKCLEEDNKDVDDQNNDPRICGKLNSAPNYYEYVKKVDANVGRYDFISTRNNNFSNRAHTLNINVNEGKPDQAEALLRAQTEKQNTAIAGGLGGAFVALIVLAGVGVVIYMLVKKKDDGGESQPRKPVAKVVGTTGASKESQRV